MYTSVILKLKTLTNFNSTLHLWHVSTTNHHKVLIYFVMEICELLTELSATVNRKIAWDSANTLT